FPLLLLKVMSIAAWQVKLYLTWLFLQKLIQMRFFFFFEFLMADSGCAAAIALIST
ncbi:hypothetical protein SEEM316_05638, partial [Salmonella enterica subsp. enterica serovar Montevideo str. 316111868]